MKTPEEKRSYNKAWRAAHPGYNAKYYLAYMKKNREKRTAYLKEWAKKHPRVKLLVDNK